MELSLAVAFDQNRLIGYNNMIPWHGAGWEHIREQVRKDMKFFRELTVGSPVIMGRTTFQTLPKPLKGRLNIVLSKKGMFDQEDKEYSVKTVKSLEEAIAHASQKASKACIIGGAQIYAQALPLVTTIYQTVFNIKFEGGYGNRVYCPQFDLTHWVSETLQSDELFTITKFTKSV